MFPITEAADKRCLCTCKRRQVATEIRRFFTQITHITQTGALHRSPSRAISHPLPDLWNRHPPSQNLVVPAWIARENHPVDPLFWRKRTFVPVSGINSVNLSIVGGFCLKGSSHPG